MEPNNNYEKEQYEDDDYYEEEWICPICSGTESNHAINCPDNDSPFAQSVRDGYD